MYISEKRYVTPHEKARMHFELPTRSRIFDWFPCPKCDRESPMINPDSCFYVQRHECPTCNHVFEVN